MSSISSYFNSTSLFVEVVTELSSGLIINILMTQAAEYHLHLSDVIRILFDEKHFSYTKLYFQRCLIDLLRFNSHRYLKIHQQIIENQLEKSNLNPNEEDHRHYSSLDKLMSLNNGYKHLNCLFNAFIIFSMEQFQYISTQLSHSSTIPKITLSSVHCLSHMNRLELPFLKDFIQTNLSKVNENLLENNDQYKNHRLQCEEDDSCQLSIDNYQELLNNQYDSIEQQMKHQWEKNNFEQKQSLIDFIKENFQFP